MVTDPRVDAYIAGSAPFVRPILEHLRAVMHRAAPEIVETIKWGMPFFDHDGSPLANMAAFKAHAAFGFWRREGTGTAAGKGEAMGQFGKLVSIADLPDDAALVAMIHDAMALVDAGAKTLRTPQQPKPAAAMPDDLQAALDAVPAAAAQFAAFPPGARREYIDWVLEAKQPATRGRRIATTVGQSAEGKRLNWKYADC